MNKQQAPTIRQWQALTIAKALELYAKTGMKVNRSYTPTAMLRTATALCGKPFKRGEYLLASNELRAYAAASNREFPQ